MTIADCVVIALFVWAECFDCVGLRALVKAVRR